MKKSLLALAVLGAFAGAAQAQTSVTIYGSFDGGLRHTNPSVGSSNLTMGSNGTYNSNRIGFRGVEDLGGGMNAHFTLETGFNTGTGAFDNAANVIFNRSAYVGLGGAWGSVDLGRQYSVNFKTIGGYDPFAYKYTGIIPLAGVAGLTRLNNDIQYTGAFGPVTVRAEYALGEVAGDTGAGATAAVGASFKTGPFSFGGAYTAGERNVAVAPATSFQDKKTWTVGGAFATGPFRVAGGYANDEQDMGVGIQETETENAWIGGSFNFTPAAAITAGYYRTEADTAGPANVRRNLVIVGGTYNLSKRTNFYADVDVAKTRVSAGGVSASTRLTGFSVGVNHLF